ncbi:MAG: hypothetical protein E6R04_00220 [Spirochaetes bacterium]|nr:MAG: hypothetical protein E6R04_00220 [Spirochaetota bacterium]
MSKVQALHGSPKLEDICFLRDVQNCGNDDIRVLEFDHVRGKKKYNISRMISGGHSRKNTLRGNRKM